MLKGLAILFLFFMALPAYAQQQLDPAKVKSFALYTFSNGCADKYYQGFDQSKLRKDQKARLKPHAEQACVCMAQALALKYNPTQIRRFGQALYSPAYDQGTVNYINDGEYRQILEFLNNDKIRESCQYFGVFRQ